MRGLFFIVIRGWKNQQFPQVSLYFINRLFFHTFSHEGKFENIQKPEFIENYLSFFQGLCSKTGRKSGFFDLSFLKIGENLSFFRPEFFWEWGKKPV